MTRAIRPALVVLVTLSATGAALAAAGARPVSPGSVDGFVAVDTPCPTFSWSAGEGATGYELIVYSAEEPGDDERRPGLETSAAPVLRQQVAGRAFSWTPSAENCLEPAGTYAWSVRAVDDLEAGAWSEAALFTVDPGPLVERIGGAIEQALSRYLAERGVVLEPDGALAAMIAGEMEPRPAAGAATGSAASSEKTVLFMGREAPVSEVEAYFEERSAAAASDPRLTSGGFGGTSAAALSDEPELVLDDEYDTSMTKAILVFKSENTFDWAWGVNSSEAGAGAGTLFLTGGDGAGDFVSFPASGGARFNEVFVQNEFQLDPTDSATGCSLPADEGKLRWDDSLGQLCGCDGSSWKRVSNGGVC